MRMKIFVVGIFGAIVMKASGVMFQIKRCGRDLKTGDFCMVPYCNGTCYDDVCICPWQKKPFPLPAVATTTTTSETAPSESWTATSLTPPRTPKPSTETVPMTTRSGGPWTHSATYENVTAMLPTETSMLYESTTVMHIETTSTAATSLSPQRTPNPPTKTSSVTPNSSGPRPQSVTYQNVTHMLQTGTSRMSQGTTVKQSGTVSSMTTPLKPQATPNQATVTSPMTSNSTGHWPQSATYENATHMFHTGTSIVSQGTTVEQLGTMSSTATTLTPQRTPNPSTETVPTTSNSTGHWPPSVTYENATHMLPTGTSIVPLGTTAKHFWTVSSMLTSLTPQRTRNPSTETVPMTSHSRGSSPKPVTFVSTTHVLPPETSRVSEGTTKNPFGPEMTTMCQHNKKHYHWKCHGTTVPPKGPGFIFGYV